MGDRVYVATVISPKEAELKVGLYGDINAANDNDAQEWRLLALDKATGKVLWNTLGLKAVPKVKRHTKASHCNSTPATDGKHIVAIFGSEGLFCFDTDGKQVWKKDLGPDGFRLLRLAHGAMGLRQFANRSRWESDRAV
jgi:outer membrane protein assembly factor BamB